MLTNPQLSADSPILSTPTALSPDSGLPSLPLELLLASESMKETLIDAVLHMSLFVGPTFGGVLYDAVTFRWAIFLIVIGELLSLIGLVSYLVYDVCTAHKREYTRSGGDTIIRLEVQKCKR